MRLADAAAAPIASADYSRRRAPPKLRCRERDARAAMSDTQARMARCERFTSLPRRRERCERDDAGKSERC